jgi:hypothetical protein
VGKFKKFLAAGIIAAGAATALAGCQSDADTVSQNLSTQADQFKVQRRIVLINDITDKYLMSVEGLCSITPGTTKIVVICEVGPGKYTKDYLGLSDNVSYLVQQSSQNATGADKYRHEVVLKPASIIPDFDLELGN